MFIFFVLVLSQLMTNQFFVQINDNDQAVWALKYYDLPNAAFFSSGVHSTLNSP